jgi:hypothetical protein
MPTVYPMTMYPPDQLAGFPHMAKRDAEVWLRFLKARGKDFVGFSYDVALGGRVLDLPDDPPETVLAWQYSTALKIDAVGFMANQVWIIEVRPDATVSAYGAAVVYTLCAKREALSELPLIPTVVCTTCQLDVEWACQQTGVQVIRV